MTLSPDIFRMDGRIALVTGAGSGLGQNIALGLAAFGAHVICADRYEDRIADTKSKLADQNCQSDGVLLDVSRDEDVARMAKDVGDKYGRVDILINCAGIVTAPNVAHKLPVADWNRLVGINLTGTFLCVHHIIPLMLKAGKGSIVNFSSIIGLGGYYPGFPASGVHYAASKAGIVGLTKQLALEYAAEGIRANAIAPGWHHSTRLGDERRAEATQEEIDRFKATVAARLPMKREGAPEELSGLAVYLASDASTYLTGQTIAHDGGWTAD